MALRLPAILPPEVWTTAIEELPTCEVKKCLDVCGCIKEVGQHLLNLYDKVLADNSLADNLDSEMPIRERILRVTEYNCLWKNLGTALNGRGGPNVVQLLSRPETDPSPPLILPCGYIAAVDQGFDFQDLPCLSINGDTLDYSKGRRRHQLQGGSLPTQNLKDYRYDPSQDLLILLGNIVEGQQQSLHFLSLLTGQPHPAATSPVMLLSGDLEVVTVRSFRVFGCLCAIMSVNGEGPATLQVWNWKSGKLVFNSGRDRYHSWGDVVSFIDDGTLLVSEDTVLLIYTHDEEDDTMSLGAVLHLPSTDGVSRELWAAVSQPHGYRYAERGRGFHPSPDSEILVIHSIRSTDTGLLPANEERSVILVVNVVDLKQLLEDALFDDNTGDVLPRDWEDWGPQLTRYFVLPSMEKTEMPTTFGSRALFPYYNGNQPSLMVLDFDVKTDGLELPASPGWDVQVLPPQPLDLTMWFDAQDQTDTDVPCITRTTALNFTPDITMLWAELVERDIILKTRRFDGNEARVEYLAMSLA